MSPNGQPTRGDAVVRAKELNVVYGAQSPTPTRALTDINFEVSQGRFVALIGPSGCGKSTLLRVLADVLPATSGEVTIGDETPNVLRAKRLTGFMFQDANLLPWYTVRENIGILAKVAKRARRREEVEELAELVGLQDFLDRYPDQLSGGMRQRVALARSYALEPQLLLMDEPFGALDEITRQRMNDELLRVWEQRQQTVFFVTHSIPEAVYLSDRILVMAPRPGRVVADIEVPASRPRREGMRFESPMVDLVAHIHHELLDAMKEH
ncbi:MAG TPA: ABC transporter ATP-binding protein [Candidatus Nocardiopsis merdipullorum]|nr:ABC transporter ATP-binding protein [Candidatus Nocardiopsis merdipullorum]